LLPFLFLIIIESVRYIICYYLDNERRIIIVIFEYLNTGRKEPIDVNVLITGSTGQLGTALIDRLRETDYHVKLTSRTKPAAGASYEWVHSDLLSGEGLEEAVKGVDIVIHAATSPMKNSKLIDVDGLKRFLDKLEHIRHFIYPSIVGINEIPFKYYRHKTEAEELLQQSHVPHTIVRATQFHSFVDELFLSKAILKTYFVPGNMKFQTVDTDDFADHLIGLIDNVPHGRVEDFGGPDIMTLREMAELKIKNNNEAKKVVSFSIPGKFHKALVEGKNTNDNQTTGKVTFEEYLKKRVSKFT
jgi:uncharacterized protein YbjT (DUF2867 family)